MTQTEILEAAIQKAIDGGWKDGEHLHADEPGSLFRMYPEATDGVHIYGSDTSVKEVIFNHDFAKALWGEKPVDRRYGGGFTSNWKTHLQQMVIADDPIEYLGEHING